MFFFALMHSQESSPWRFSSSVFTFEYIVHGVLKSRPTWKVTEGMKNVLLGCLDTEAHSAGRLSAS